MRPLRLDLAGFGAFRDETTVDFTDTDFFVLVGPTGSGKSTVLDAICFALYGTVPRWRNTSSVANALAPSATEARVRLAFETAGQRFVATRVVRRDGKGRVKTASAGLQRMPDSFDVRRLETGLSPEDLGEVLAGTPSEMDTAVPEVVGLPYHQFVTCVLLPQGEFAEFLHAKPATRQQILVNLLGLSAYQRVRERAAGRATAATAELAATDRLLADLAEVDDAALATAEQRVDTLRRLAEQVAAALPELAAAQAGQDGAAGALRTRDGQIGQLAAVRPPVAVAALAGSAATARDARDRAADAVGTAEEREEKLRSELAAAGDPSALRALLAAHRQRGQLADQQETLAGTVAAAQRAHDQAVDGLTQARARSQQAQAELAAAREAFGQAQTADAAAALRAHLVAGAPCPVCTHPVGSVPPIPADSAVAHAEQAGKQARAAADAAERAVAELDIRLRDRDRALTAAGTQAELLAARCAELDAQLAGVPAPATLERELAGIAGTEQRLAEAAAAVRTAREAYRRSQAEADAAAERLTAAWREFESARDALAGFAPPPADRDEDRKSVV